MPAGIPAGTGGTGTARPAFETACGTIFVATCAVCAVADGAARARPRVTTRPVPTPSASWWMVLLTVLLRATARTPGTDGDLPHSLGATTTRLEHLRSLFATSPVGAPPPAEVTGEVSGPGRAPGRGRPGWGAR